MPFGWGGRGYRWMYWLTGLPGWARFGYPWSYAWWRCRFFPWLPRWWWTGIYGPVVWTEFGPTIANYTHAQCANFDPNTQICRLFGIKIDPNAPACPNFAPRIQPPSKEEEIGYLKEELKALEEEKRILEREIEDIKRRLKELEGKE